MAEIFFRHHLVLVVRASHNFIDGGIGETLIVDRSGQGFQFVLLRVAGTVEHVFRIAHTLLGGLIFSGECSRIHKVLDAAVLFCCGQDQERTISINCMIINWRQKVTHLYIRVGMGWGDHNRPEERHQS